jgi:hypothetical protein
MKLYNNMELYILNYIINDAGCSQRRRLPGNNVRTQSYAYNY